MSSYIFEKEYGEFQWGALLSDDKFTFFNMPNSFYPDCVYIAFNDYYPCYVGVTENIKNRIREHNRKSKWCKEETEFRTIKCKSYIDALTLEAFIIHDVQPECNKRLKDHDTPRLLNYDFLDLDSEGYICFKNKALEAMRDW